MKDEFKELREKFGYKYSPILYYIQGTKDLIRYFVFNRSNILFRLLVLFPKQASLMVSKDTEITIEGFPGSANSFAVEAFKMSQLRPVKIAHHLHLPNQILYSVKWKIPVLLLIRDPLDAVASVVSRTFITKYSYFYASPYLLLHYYIYFYSKLFSVKEKIVIADFKEIIEDFGEVIKKVNKYYKTSFIPFESTKDNVKRILQKESLRLAKPLKIREELKQKVKIEIENKYKKLLSKAFEIYYFIKGK